MEETFSQNKKKSTRSDDDDGQLATASCLIREILNPLRAQPLYPIVQQQQPEEAAATGKRSPAVVRSSSKRSKHEGTTRSPDGFQIKVIDLEEEEEEAKEDRKLPAVVFSCGPNDVLESEQAFDHEGNQRFHLLVEQTGDQNRDVTSRNETMFLVGQIREAVTKAGGRFLKETEPGQWCEMEPAQVRQKILNALCQRAAFHRNEACQRIQRSAERLARACGMETDAKVRVNMSDVLHCLNDIKTELSSEEYTKLKTVALKTYKINVTELEEIQTRAANAQPSDASAQQPVPLPKVQDVVDYINQVKREFPGGHVCDEFLAVLKTFQSGGMSVPQVKAHVTMLFKGNDKLLFGFNIFLPEQHHFEQMLLNQPAARIHAKIVCRMGAPPTDLVSASSPATKPDNNHKLPPEPLDQSSQEEQGQESVNDDPAEDDTQREVTGDEDVEEEDGGSHYSSDNDDDEEEEEEEEEEGSGNQQASAARIEPTINDVLLAPRHGSDFRQYAGNMKLAFLIHQARSVYHGSQSKNKALLVKEVVKQVKGQTPPGRFLKLHNPTTREWIEVNDEYAYMQVLQMFLRPSALPPGVRGSGSGSGGPDRGSGSGGSGAQDAGNGSGGGGPGSRNGSGHNDGSNSNNSSATVNGNQSSTQTNTAAIVKFFINAATHGNTDIADVMPPHVAKSARELLDGGLHKTPKTKTTNATKRSGEPISFRERGRARDRVSRHGESTSVAVGDAFFTDANPLLEPGWRMLARRSRFYRAPSPAERPPRNPGPGVATVTKDPPGKDCVATTRINGQEADVQPILVAKNLSPGDEFVATIRINKLQEKNVQAACESLNDDVSVASGSSYRTCDTGGGGRPPTPPPPGTDEFGCINESARDLFDEAVIDVALYNYESFYKLEHGSATFEVVHDTSAGIPGWAASLLLNDEKPDDNASEATTATTTARKSRGDEEEARQLQIALLESVGANPTRRLENVPIDYDSDCNSYCASEGEWSFESGSIYYDDDEDDCEDDDDEEEEQQKGEQEEISDTHDATEGEPASIEAVTDTTSETPAATTAAAVDAAEAQKEPQAIIPTASIVDGIKEPDGEDERTACNDDDKNEKNIENDANNTPELAGDEQRRGQRTVLRSSWQFQALMGQVKASRGESPRVLVEAAEPRGRTNDDASWSEVSESSNSEGSAVVVPRRGSGSSDEKSWQRVVEPSSSGECLDDWSEISDGDGR